MVDNDNTSNKHAKPESRADRLRRAISPGMIGVDIVAAFSGDREMSPKEKTMIEKQKELRGDSFYSDLFYTLCHHYFAPNIAEELWHKVLSHKEMMKDQLNRPVTITVATLDYLSNIKSKFISPTLISEAHISELANLSMRDGMTGLYNHTSCYEILTIEIRNHRRYSKGLSIIMMDIDDFKSVNDQFGHQEGDRVLVELANTITEQLRDSDICCRFGGEEFLAILPFEDDRSEIVEIAERIRKETMKIKCGEHCITISLGISSYREKETSEEFVENADNALYEAKKRGKNQVVYGV